jgi:hypothetical protein
MLTSRLSAVLCKLFVYIPTHKYFIYLHIVISFVYLFKVVALTYLCFFFFFLCFRLAAMLEAREDDAIHEQLTRKLEISAYDGYRANLEKSILDILSNIKAEARPRTAIEIAEIQSKQTAMVAVWTLLIEINYKKVSELRVEKQEQLVGLIEIAWRNKVQRTCFALPFEMNYLTNTTKQKFIEEVDLSTAEKRMSELIKQTDLFISGMCSFLFFKFCILLFSNSLHFSCTHECTHVL